MITNPQLFCIILGVALSLFFVVRLVIHVAREHDGIAPREYDITKGRDGYFRAWVYEGVEKQSALDSDSYHDYDWYALPRNRPMGPTARPQLCVTREEAAALIEEYKNLVSPPVP